MPAVSTDRIEKEIVIKAPRSKVWRALTDASQFGTWFGCDLRGQFAPGATISGKITSKGFDHLTIDFEVERIDPETYFSYRWHPYPMDLTIDYTKEPTTLVEFRLEEVDGGTRLITVESGFDRLPASRRDEAFRMNDGGWTSQMKRIEKYVTT